MIVAVTEKDRRKQLKQEYKQTPRAMGIYQIRNIVNGKVFVGSSKNLDGIFNRHRFGLTNGGHINKDLQKDWNDLGQEHFAFEILEQLKPNDDPQYDYTEELQIMEELWLEKLQPYQERGYNKPARR